MWTLARGLFVARVRVVKQVRMYVLSAPLSKRKGEWCGRRGRIMGRRSSTRKVHHRTTHAAAGGSGHRRCRRPPKDGDAVRAPAAVATAEGASLVVKFLLYVRTGYPHSLGVPTRQTPPLHGT